MRAFRLILFLLAALPALAADTDHPVNRAPAVLPPPGRGAPEKSRRDTPTGSATPDTMDAIEQQRIPYLTDQFDLTYESLEKTDWRAWGKADDGSSYRRREISGVHIVHLGGGNYRRIPWTIAVIIKANGDKFDWAATVTRFGDTRRDAVVPPYRPRN